MDMHWPYAYECGPVDRIWNSYLNRRAGAESWLAEDRLCKDRFDAKNRMACDGAEAETRRPLYMDPFLDLSAAHRKAQPPNLATQGDEKLESSHENEQSGCPWAAVPDVRRLGVPKPQPMLSRPLQGPKGSGELTLGTSERKAFA